MTNRLKNLNFYPGRDFSGLRQSIKNIANKCFYGFKSCKVFSPIFTKKDMTVLKNLGMDKNLVITKPDKGNGVVILNKADYVSKMKDILYDFTKFEVCRNINIFQLMLKLEDKINRVLRKLLNKGIIGNDEYKDLYAKGSSPAILYGLPKIHKNSVPLRPVMAAYKTFSYKLAKYIVPILSPFTSNEYTLKNSYEFFDSLKNFTLPRNFYMTSFDITSLFTNIPLDETIQISLDHLYQNGNEHRGMTRTEFKELMSLCVKESYCLFDEVIYKQIDGCAMGSPISGTLANLFLCQHEQQWLENCPEDFKPLYYKRYVDDTFVIFKEPAHSRLFLEYLNNQHQNIKFTMEEEVDGKLAFLDLMVRRNGDNIDIGIYRKPTFSGLGTSFFSFSPLKYKINTIKTLLFRAYNLTSSFITFDKEISFLRGFFVKNGFTKSVFDKQVNVFLNKIYEPKAKDPTVPKQIMYFSLPFLGETSKKIEKDLKRIFFSYFPHVEFRFAHNNNFRVRSFFPFKDKLPQSIRSSVIYKFSCPSCQLGYIGSSTRAFKIRIDSHLGCSSRTGLPLTRPEQSAVRLHTENICKCRLESKNFEILDSVSGESDLRVLESLYIAKEKPQLNRDSTAVPLYIL